MPVMTDEGTEKAAAGDGAVEIDESAAVDETVADESAEPAFVAARSRRISARTAGVATGFAALLAGTGVLGWQVWQNHQLNLARDEAQRAAVSYAQVLTSIDSAKVDENFKEVIDGATGDFKDMYSKSSVELRQLLIENKATAHGVVVDSAVEAVTRDRAVVLLFVDQSVTNTKLPDPRIDRSRMKMTLEKVDGAWRAAKVELP